MLNPKQTCADHHDHDRFATFFLRPVQKSTVNGLLISTVLWRIFFEDVVSVGIQIVLQGFQWNLAPTAQFGNERAKSSDLQLIKVLPGENLIFCQRRQASEEIAEVFEVKRHVLEWHQGRNSRVVSIVLRCRVMDAIISCQDQLRASALLSRQQRGSTRYLYIRRQKALCEESMLLGQYREAFLVSDKAVCRDQHGSNRFAIVASDLLRTWQIFGQFQQNA